MQGWPEYRIDGEHVFEVLITTADAIFGRLHRIRNGMYREVGTVTAYKQQADAEMHRAHWRAECYILQKSYSDLLLEGVGQQLLANTACTEPLYIIMRFSEPTDSRSKSFGKVFQDEDD